MVLIILESKLKKRTQPDWMQCSIKYKNNNWEGSKHGKIPIKSRNIFDDILQQYIIFDGNIPPFMTQHITHDEWKNIKNNTDMWNDHYIDVPNDTIKRLYKNKDCYYIQISDGIGLYHLGNDICNFNVSRIYM